MTEEHFRDDIETIVEENLSGAYFPSKPIAVEGRKVEVEFWCQECSHYIYVKMNTGLEGNHVMVCPKCGHKHYRVVKRGIITQDRYNENEGLADEIIAMPSAAVPKDQRRQRGNIAIIRELELCGVLK